MFEQISNSDDSNSKDDDDEQLRNFNYVDSKSDRYVSISSTVQHFINMLNYPVNIFLNINESLTENQNNFLKLIKDELPCDIQLVNLRTQNNVDFEQDPSSMAFLILFRNQFDCSVVPSPYLTRRSCHEIRPMKIDFTHVVVDTIQESSLTGLYAGKYLNQFSDFDLDPMQVKSLNITFVK